MAELSILNGYKIKDKKAIRFYDTVADMINDTTLKSGMHVKTKGYYQLNDDGGAEYLITDTENSNAIQIELNNNLYAEHIINDFINIKSLGAKGDGINEDTAAFQNAIDYNYSLDKPYIIFIPNGTYVLGNINIRKNTTIKGSGWGSTYLKAKNGLDTNLLSITESDAYFINLSDFTILGNKDNNTCTNGIYIKRDTITHDPVEEPKHAGDLWLTIERVRITGVYGNGIGTGSSGSNFRESRFNNIDVNNCGGYGLYLGGSDNNYFQITAWGNTLDGFKIFGSAERYISCKSFANGDDNHASFGFDIVGTGFQFSECEAQENYGHGFNLRGTPSSNYVIRTDANGKIEKGTGTYTYAGVNFVENTTNVRINMVVQCYDFIKASGGDSSQGYGVIFGDNQQCNINVYAWAQANGDYLVNKAYTLNPSAKNIFIVNGVLLSTATIKNINMVNDEGNTTAYFGGDSSTGESQYRVFRASNGNFRIDDYYNNLYKGNPLFINWDNTNSRTDIRIASGITDRVGFFGSFGDVRQSVTAVATDTASTQDLVNSIRSALVKYGLVNGQ